ncbi:MAG: DUF1641 domain-containing protein [Thermoplasmata archaeon]|jgi:hypothetical protein|nr:DUF1641 domain-containing protein [Thermoplasmata archaeon]
MATTSTPSPPGAPTNDGGSGLQVLNDRLLRWQADGTLDRLFALAEGVVGITDAVTDRMLGSAGSTLVGALSLVDWIAQDERRRDVLFYLVEKLAEWKETGALETLVTLLEGAVGVAQATSDEMVASAGASAVGWVRFVESLPAKEEMEPLIATLVENAPALTSLASSLQILSEPERRERELARVPAVSGIFGLGRALGDPEIQRGVRLALLVFKEMGRQTPPPARP